MTKKPLAAERNKNSDKNSKTLNKTKTKSATAINTKRKIKNENENINRKTANGYASNEETQVLVAPSSSTESENGDVVESDADRVEERSSSGEDEEETETLKSIMRKGGNVGGKNKGKRRSKIKNDDESLAEEKGGNCLYRFPMNRVSRIIKSENPDVKISQEAVFVINRAAEKFLQVFCREAYACTFLENKKHTAYNHLSSVVSRQKRLNFLSDFIPEKVKAEDALAQISEAEKSSGLNSGT